MAKLKTGLIGHDPLNDKSIEDGDAAAADSSYEKAYLWSRKIEPGKTLRVVFNYQLVKERSDNEVWTSLLPSEPIEVSVTQECHDLEWDVDALFTGALVPFDGLSGSRLTGKVRYNSSVPLLPRQGVVLWWRPNSKAAGKSVIEG